MTIAVTVTTAPRTLGRRAATRRFTALSSAVTTGVAAVSFALATPSTVLPAEPTALHRRPYRR
ncbi:hypothetical protein WEI85_44330 [Actinomycetes bacterium KLBMP 9797]